MIPTPIPGFWLYGVAENVTVYGMSYWHKKLPKRCYDNLGVVSTDRINILLAHGGDESHIPYSAKQVLGQGIDYVAGGHIHMGRQLVEDRAIIAGSLEPTEAADVGPHGYWIGEIVKQNGKMECHCHFYPIKKCEYCNETIEVTPKTTMYELEGQIKELLTAGESYKMYVSFNILTVTHKHHLVFVFLIQTLLYHLLIYSFLIL